MFGTMWLPVALLLKMVVAGSIYHQQSKYKVVFDDGKIPENAVDSFMSLNPNLGTVGKFAVVDVSLSNSLDKYLCFLPHVQETVDSDETTAITQKSNSNLVESAVKLVEESFDRSECVFAFTLHGDYWTFAYCFGDKIIQYHEDLLHFIKTSEHRPTQPNFVYTLGRFPGAPKSPSLIANQAKNLHNNITSRDFTIFDSSLSPLVSDFHSQGGSQKMVQHTLYDGEVCDVTKQPRTIDVVYKCDGTNGLPLIVDLSEIQTCKYQMIINVPKLCLLPEFRPVNRTEKETEIECKAIDGNVISNKHIQDYNDFFHFTPTDELERLFPHKNQKVNLRDYLLQPIGSGFFLAFIKESLTPDSFLKKRTVFFYNQDWDNPTDLLDNFADMYKSVMNRKIPSPRTIDETRVAALSWNDTFVVWYDLYDFYGKLNSVVRVARDGSLKRHTLDFQIVNPDTMLDQDGDKVEVGEFSSPNGMSNFESYYHPGKGNNAKPPVVPTSTVFVTRTIDSINHTSEAESLSENDSVQLESTTDNDDLDTESTDIESIESIEPTSPVDDELSSIDTESTETPTGQATEEPVEQDFFELLASELGIDDHETLQKLLDNLNLELIFQDRDEPEHDEL